MVADVDTLLLAVAGAIGAGLAALVAGLFVRRRTSAEAADIITQAAERLVKRYESHMADLERRLEDVEREWAACKGLRQEDRLLLEQQVVQIDELRRQVERLSRGDE